MQEEFDPWVGKIPWKKEWQPTRVFLPGKSHRQRSLAGYSPWGHKESLDTHQRSQQLGNKILSKIFPLEKQCWFYTSQFWYVFLQEIFLGLTVRKVLRIWISLFLQRLYFMKLYKQSISTHNPLHWLLVLLFTIKFCKVKTILLLPFSLQLFYYWQIWVFYQYM